MIVNQNMNGRRSQHRKSVFVVSLLLLLGLIPAKAAQDQTLWPEQLLTAILNPSAAIEPRFVNYLVTTRDGRMYDGVLANETAGAITLRGGSEEDVTLPRAQIAEIRASSISLMPEDLEKNLSRQDLADIIAYLRGGL